MVFGNVARGTARKDSDLDILIVVEDLPRARFDRLALYLEAEKRLDPLLDELLINGYAISITPILKSREEAKRIKPVYLDMTEDAIIVYDKDGFFENILMYLRDVLRRLGSKRVWIGRKWYWILKEDFRFGEVITIE
ncbi:MAG: nucleotidyltransferase domain-containing protein [Candidatus Bathyarchaeota archaeon]|nr:nucleotidyltransferase domain-containing protein [Candidatus Bathyarchaeota archaeon]MCX8162523.1 nucleotidyltransferase domain-containing protein [Candidatus Bathyarchaeota archaeon]